MDWANVTPGELMDALREVRVLGLVTRRAATLPDAPGRRARDPETDPKPRD